MKPKLITLFFAAIVAGLALPAIAEIAVVINPKNSVASMSQEQLSQFFLGVSTSFVPVDQADGSSIRTEFYKKITNKEPSQVRAIWAKLVFTGRGRPPKEYPSSTEVKQAVSADINTIGYIEKSAADSSVKILMTIP